MTALITAPEGYDATRHAEHASRVLRYLLISFPNTVIGHADVTRVLGYPVTAQAVSNAAGRLRRGPFGLPIESRPGSGGGYVLLTPVAAPGRESCRLCLSRSLVGTCKRLKGRPVDDAQWCWSWS